MDYRAYGKQYEFECQCGYSWIDSENNGCPMCGEQIEITIKDYQSLPVSEFNRGK